jgi:farnesyl-diphosphate farnesyltransferase
MQLPPRIKEAVMSSYLLLRAIDEIEDHPQLDKREKVGLLCALSTAMRPQQNSAPRTFSAILRPHRDQLQEVTNRIYEWLSLSPRVIAPMLQQTTSMMAQRMAYWVNNGWRIRTKHDLDRYTFSVAGAVGILLSDLWMWYDGTPSRRANAIRYGRGLQAVNILRNRAEDLARGVDFFPDGWSEADFLLYAKQNMLRGDDFVSKFPPGPAHEFCLGPQALAYATLAALERGESKLSRDAVLRILANPDSALIAEEKVILVNERDEMIGVERKSAVHLTGALHRAFSVFVLNNSGQLLLQKRTIMKHHS